MGAPRRKLFRFLWGVDALIAAIFVGFFFWGLADGTVSSFNIVLGSASWRASPESSAEAIDSNRKATRGPRWGCC